MDVSVNSRAILDYQKAVKDAEALLNQKMSEAFAEIQDRYGVTPTVVELYVVEARPVGSFCAQGVYNGCRLEFGSE
ncbi:hypothetical protein [Stutzerimonas stutzeri]|uniref:Uncharacterized protein n=1 Tax=Stutzerimonas stutzeri TaxID=316 RepID=A0AA42P9H3_STUST|nr:hypothetical protein [Stutzerimonas stutzeri]MDH1237256.1 hypothetical protein [Stutzerimonas stutzeri]MDH1556846.1 hypothetical protein [Stutzerimonas stutzeri]